IHVGGEHGGDPGVIGGRERAGRAAGVLEHAGAAAEAGVAGGQAAFAGRRGGAVVRAGQGVFLQRVRGGGRVVRRRGEGAGDGAAAILPPSGAGEGDVVSAAGLPPLR